MTQRAILVAVVAALGLSACGDDDDSGSVSGPDPATLAPADSLVYVEAAVRPDDERAEEAEATLGALLDQADPGAAIAREIESGIAEEGTEFSYAEDIEPWLGERLGAFFLDFEGDADGAFVLSTTDVDEARAGLDRIAAQEGTTRDASHNGASYSVTEEDTAYGIVDDFAVIGSEAGFEAAVDAAGGGSLAEDADFESAAGDSREQGIVTAYVDPEAALAALIASGEITAQQRAAAVEAAAGRLDAPVVLSAGAEDGSLYLELAAAAGSAEAGTSALLERVPGDASIAFALSGLGERLAPALARAAADPHAGAGLDRLEAQTGIDPAATAESVDDVAGYFRGTSILGLGGALIFETDDQQAATAILDRVQAALADDPSVAVQPGDDEGEAFSVSPAGVPIEFPFVLRDGLVVAGLGDGSVEQVFAPESSLAGSDAEAAATSALGDGFELSALVDFEPLLELLQGLPGATDDPDFQAALPYLERSDLLVAGVREADGRPVSRVALEVDEEAE